MNSNKPLLTVIIPYYNRSDLITETIESIESQSRKDFKILVIDDGSSDNGKEIIENLNKKYNNIQYVYKENGGVSSARNRGIELSETKYISFLDSDDLYKENFVKVMLSDIATNNADISFCSYYNYRSGRSKKAKTSFNDKDIILEYIKGNNSTHISCFVMDREFIVSNNIKFDEKLNLGEDIYFLVETMSNAKKISVVKDYLTYYRNDENEDKLSNYKVTSLEKDKLFINKLLSDDNVKLSLKEKDAFISYRLPALLTYGLLILINQGYPIEELKNLYEKYKNDINKFKMTSDLRSIKLKLSILKLKRTVGK